MGLATGNAPTDAIVLEEADRSIRSTFEKGATAEFKADSLEHVILEELKCEAGRYLPDLVAGIQAQSVDAPPTVFEDLCKRLRCREDPTGDLSHICGLLSSHSEAGGRCAQEGCTF